RSDRGSHAHRGRPGRRAGGAVPHALRDRRTDVAVEAARSPPDPRRCRGGTRRDRARGAGRTPGPDPPGSPRAPRRGRARYGRVGFGCLKIRAGGEVVGRASAVRAKVGPAVRVRVDANGTWPERLAIETMRDLRPLDLEYVEQPIPPSLGAAALARVRRTGGVPVAADEAVTDPEGAAELLL